MCKFYAFYAIIEHYFVIHAFLRNRKFTMVNVYIYYYAKKRKKHKKFVEYCVKLTHILCN